MCKELIESVKVAAAFAERSRTEYADTKEWTSTPGHSCATIRVPVAMLNRLREAGALAADPEPGKPTYGELLASFDEIMRGPALMTPRAVWRAKCEAAKELIKRAK